MVREHQLVDDRSSPKPPSIILVEAQTLEGLVVGTRLENMRES